MTRKHFELIAATIADLNVGDATRTAIAQDFARSLAGTNANFDRARFVRAATASNDA